MQTARVRLFSLFGAMLFLLNLLVSNVIYHNLCILSTLILKNLMYFKSMCELTTISAPRIHHFSSPSPPFPSHCPLTLCSPPLCPRLTPLSHYVPAFPCFTLASPSPFFHTSAFYAPCSAPPLGHSLPLFHAPLLYSFPLFWRPFFYSPMTAANPSAAPQRAAFFSFFKEILQKPLTKRKKVLY